MWPLCIVVIHSGGNEGLSNWDSIQLALSHLDPYSLQKLEASQTLLLCFKYKLDIHCMLMVLYFELKDEWVHIDII